MWILDLAEPEIGINPLLIPGRPDAVADAVVEGFRDTNEDGAIMASSDRYLRQAAIGALVLAHEERRMPTMGDLYRLLLPHEDTMRRRVAELCDTHGELAFTSVFFGESLPGDLKDARSQTTVKLDAPRNKIEALLGVPSVNRMLHHPFQRSLHDIIAERDVLVVRGASGSIGEGNAIKVLTWLLRCLDAALSDQQQKPEADRVRVALKVDEAHLLLSPTFARMLAVHRSAGLEAMCAWQQLSQIKDLAVREATTNLLQNRIVFRMNNPEDARAEIGVMMSAYADVLHGTREARELTRFQPDMLVNLDVFYALCSWVAGGRRADAFVGRTIRPREDPELIAHHERAQRERGAFVVERLPNLVAPRSWVRRAAVVGVERRRRRGRAPAGRRRGRSAAGGRPPHRTPRLSRPTTPGQRRPPKLRTPSRADEASETTISGASDAAPAADSPPERPAPERRLRRVRIDAEPFDPARTGGGDPREVIDSQPVGTHISLERSYTELAIDQPLRLKYEPARSLADEKALARVDVRAKEILAALHEAGFLLAPQIGRRFWPEGTNERNIQRALTRMAELGLVERFRVITADGGTQPFVYQLTKGGFEYAQTQRGPHGPFIHPDVPWRERKVSDPRYVLHNLHAIAWVLAFERAAGRFVRAWHGPGHPLARPRVPRVKEDREWVNLGPRHLKPPPNMAIHGLKFPANVDVARQEFEGLEADALIELAIPSGNSTRRVDVFVEMDRTRRPSKNSPKFRRYDHFITGWSTLLDRYAEALKERPIVVFVCEDGDQALDFLKLADSQVTGAIGVKGTELAEWQHPARERMFFVAERDLHSGTLRALRLPDAPAQGPRRPRRTRRAPARAGQHPAPSAAPPHPTRQHVRLRGAQAEGRRASPSSAFTGRRTCRSIAAAARSRRGNSRRAPRPGAVPGRAMCWRRRPTAARSIETTWRPRPSRPRGGGSARAVCRPEHGLCRRGLARRRHRRSAGQRPPRGSRATRASRKHCRRVAAVVEQEHGETMTSQRRGERRPERPVAGIAGGHQNRHVALRLSWRDEPGAKGDPVRGPERHLASAGQHCCGRRHRPRDRNVDKPPLERPDRPEQQRRHRHHNEQPVQHPRAALRRRAASRPALAPPGARRCPPREAP